ncbi:MAG TPA: cell division protein ZapB [Thermoanaerobaculia bacterium]|nr:cell division protein ZapB [Thermoanaerobaculia bacterium]
MAIDWLEELEGKVREATRRLGELREENRELARRVEELEGRLAAQESGEGFEEGAGWAQEREEIRRRVEKLTATLEELEEL